MRRLVIMILTLLVSVTAMVSAQRRGGLRYTLGLAPGWVHVGCTICGSKREPGVSAFLGLGGRTSRYLQLAGELAGWRASDANVTQSLLSVSAAGYWYPNLRRRFYLKGGAALVMHRASDGTDVVTASGLGPQMGIGYELPITGNWLLSPFFHYSLGVLLGDVKFNGGQAASSAQVSFFQVGLSLKNR
jgi:hypothetical protein